MPTRAAVAGLVKHQLMFSHLAPEDVVTTVWTWKAATADMAARIAFEQGQIAAWFSSDWRAISKDNYVTERVKSWDFATTPPTKYASLYTLPRLIGTILADAAPAGTGIVVALRTQPLNSGIRNRLNGRIIHPSVGTVGTTTFSSPTSGAVLAAYNNLLSRLKTATNPTSGDWSVVSWFEAGAARVPPVVLPVNHLIVRALPGWKQSRMPKAGPYARGA